jgi:hypothetical protein
MSDVGEEIERSSMSTVGTSASGALEMVETTTWLTSRTPHTTSRTRHDVVREGRVSGQEVNRKSYENLQTSWG